jgi:hypothetical protein
MDHHESSFCRELKCLDVHGNIRLRCTDLPSGGQDISLIIHLDYHNVVSIFLAMRTRKIWKSSAE